MRLYEACVSPGMHAKKNVFRLQEKLELGIAHSSLYASTKKVHRLRSESPLQFDVDDDVRIIWQIRS